MINLPNCTLYTFIDTAYLNGRDPVEVARQLCDGGSDLIQLRAKGSTVDEVRRLAESILPITQNNDVGLVINDHFALASDLGVPLCHLGQEDFFESGNSDVNQLRGDSTVPQIGISTHSPEQAERAVAAGADYIAIGPVYSTPTKPSAQPVTLEYVRWAAAHISRPWFAIGGIHLDNLDEVLEAGARRICVVSAILKSTDIALTCQQFKKQLPSASSE
ncbi:MAG TPA: thiamine phosphate synthase [Verrucomicrobiales bacterium]|nr:thiamine phosphate synthase [Verrucomicrobiales bacterium]